MTRRPLAVIVAGIGLCVASPDAQQQSVFRSSVDSVVVDVAVISAGVPVADLTAADFEVRDNGIVQPVADISYETLPIDVTFVVDVSGSVGPLLDSLTRAITGVSARLRTEDHARLVTFNDRIVEHRDLTASVGETLAGAFKATEGHTSLLDAVAMSLITEAQPGRRRMAIVFTDGRDNLSILNETAVMDIAKRSGQAVFTVALIEGVIGSGVISTSGLRQPPRLPPPVPHEALFRSLAGVTGGRFLALPRNQDLGASFVEAFEAFRTSYVLRYMVQGVARGGWHDITVQVTRSGTYDIRARKGYFGG